MEISAPSGRKVSSGDSGVTGRSPVSRPGLHDTTYVIGENVYFSSAMRVSKSLQTVAIDFDPGNIIFDVIPPSFRVIFLKIVHS